MNRKWFYLMVVAFCSVCSLVLVGCLGGDDDDDGGAASTPVDVTGTWDVQATGYDVLVLTLNQAADGTVTGTAARSADSAAITGTNTNNAITLSATFAPGDFINMTGTVTGTNTMSGRLTNATTVGYTDPWSATRR